MGGTHPPTLRHADHTQTCSTPHALASVAPVHAAFGTAGKLVASPSGTISTASIAAPSDEKRPIFALFTRAPSTRR